MRRRLLLAMSVVVLIFTAACDSHLTPDPPTASESSSIVHVSGQVLAYSSATTFNPISGANLVGWADGGEHSGPTGPIPLDSNARFTLIVDRGARLRLYAGGGTGDEIYQPCAVTVVANGNVSRDVKVVADYSIIGAAIPRSFLDGTRILSGQVYESVPGVGRQPVPFATVSVNGFRDWNHDFGWPIAITRTDNDGRYIICGLEADTSASVYVIDWRHEMLIADVDLKSDAVLDLDVSRTVDAPARAFLSGLNPRKR